MSEIDSIRFRPAVPADAERLSVLMRDTFVAAYGHCSSAQNVAAYLHSSYSPPRQLAEIEDPRMLTVLAVDGDDWSGFAQLRWEVTAAPEVSLARPMEVVRFYLLPSHHGSGLAARQMDHLADAARARGGDGLWLNVWQQSPKAIRFYEKQGFRIVGRSIFPVGADAQEDWVMQRDFAV